MIQRWYSSDPDIRGYIKQKGYLTLQSPVKLASNAAAQLVSSIAVVEFQRNDWPDLMEKLFQQTSNANQYNQEVALKCLSLICADVKPEYLRQYNSSILETAVRAIQEKKGPDTVLHAERLISHSLKFIDNLFIQNPVRSSIFNCLQTLFTIPDHNIRYHAYDIVYKIVQFYYPFISECMSGLFNVTLSDIQGNSQNPQVNDSLIQFALEFWLTVCDAEIPIKQNNKYQDSVIIDPFKAGLTPTDNKNLQIIQKTYQQLWPCLYTILSNKPPDYTNDEWNQFMTAASVLKSITEIVGSDMLDLTRERIEEDIKSPNWQRRDAAIQTLGCLMIPKKQSVKSFLLKHLPTVLAALRTDESLVVRDTASWTILNLSIRIPSLVTNRKFSNLLDETFQTLSSALQPGFQLHVRKNACTALAYFFKDAAGSVDHAKNFLSPYYKTFFQAFLNILFETEQDPSLFQLRTNCLVAMNNLITYSAADLQDTLLQSLTVYTKRTLIHWDFLLSICPIPTR